MSTFAWGAFILEDEFIPDSKMISCYPEIIKFSYMMTTYATTNALGIIFSVNIWSRFHDVLSGNIEQIPFQLTDNPLTNVCEVTFVGDNVKVYGEGIRADTGESLDSRISRVQKFLQQAFDTNMVKQILLYIGYDDDYGNPATECSISRFKETLLTMYQGLEGYTPDVKMIITK